MRTDTHPPPPATRPPWRAALLLLSVLLAVVAWPGPARAKVTLPSGKTIPDPVLTCQNNQPGGLAAIFACACTQSGVCNIGKPCPGGSTSCDPGTYGTCETTIWHSVNDNTCIPSNSSGLDPVNDATTKPETFRPACGLTFTLLTRGNAMFKNGFGWYNVTGKKPDPADLNILVDCKTAAGSKTNFNMLSSSAYKGGDIGFFLVTPESHTQPGTCASGDCCATVARLAKGEGYVYYSEAKHNPDNDAAGSYVHLLTYASKILTHAFYFTWEDTYKGSSTDYADFVTGVSGISCAGAGVKCSTGKKGICDMGVTKCDSQGVLTCSETFSAESEKCDGLDNDCDGTADNGAVCTAGKVCYKGTCVAKCTTGTEFACQLGFECDGKSGMCIDTKCKTVTCKSDEICRLGICGNGCSGVVCPKDQLCLGGLCVDPCAGRSCKTKEICKLGVCLPDCTQCGGVTCTGSETCNQTTGDCHDPSCKPACTSGTYCKGGKCTDLCEGVKCPGNMTCAGGKCPPPGITKAKSGTDGAPPWYLDGGSTSGDGTDPQQNKPFYTEESGCSCTLRAQPVRPPSAGSLLGGLALLCGVLLLLLRRRPGRQG